MRKLEKRAISLIFNSDNLSLKHSHRHIQGQKSGMLHLFCGAHKIAPDVMRGC